jgi:uncharacterized coiled-coil protein SlyX
MTIEQLLKAIVKQKNVLYQEQAKLERMHEELTERTNALVNLSLRD